MASIIKQISELKDVEDQSEVTVRGVIVGLKEIPCKNDNSMGFAILDDNSGEIELVIYSTSYNTTAPIIKSDQIIIVNGILSVSDNGAQILVNGKDDIYYDTIA